MSLVDEVASSDELIFAALYPSLRRFAAVIRPPEVDGDDLVQEALMRALSTHSLSEFDDLGAYLQTTMVRIASNHRRRLGRGRRATVRVAASTDQEHAPEYPSDLADLRRLKPTDRAVLYLALVEERPFREVASLVGCSEQAARARASRALRRLRVELNEEQRDG